MIELSGVTKIYNQGAPNECRSISQVTLSLETGKVTCFQGPSGSGKTTLLAMIGCLSRPTQGRITLNGEILSGLPERFTAKIRRDVFGFVFQHFNLIRGVSVLENIMLPAYPLGTPYTGLKSRALSLLDRFGLTGKKNLSAETLSGGEAQRVAICRALVNDPPILIADEPTANLDSGLSAELMAIVMQLKQMGKTVLLSSHDPLIFKSPDVDRVVTMRDGRIMPRDSHAV